jgi:hypothetical protein
LECKATLGGIAAIACQMIDRRAAMIAPKY